MKIRGKKLKTGVRAGNRDYEQEATSVEIPNLVITFAESHARSR